MRLSVYVMLMFALAFSFYMMGFRAPAFNDQSALSTLGGQQKNMTGGSSFFSYDAVITSLISGVTSGSTISQILNPAAVLTGVVIGATLLLSGFSAIYILAALMLVLFLNAMVFPTSMLLTPEIMASVGDPFSLPLAILFNILLILAVLSFTRGGGI